jgi:hypothetical protein
MQKKRGRPALQAPETKEVQINETALLEAVVARDAAAIAQEVFTPSRAALHEAMGRMKAMKAVSSITTAISLQNLKIIKESKEYRMLKGQPGATPDGQPIADLGTWDGFCRSLGMSPDKADEDLRNLVVFGQEALDRMSALGAGYRDLRQYRELPDDKRQALIEVAKSGDKHDFLDLAEELIARHAKREDELNRQIADGKKELAATEERLAIVHRQRAAAEGKEAERALMTEAERFDEMRKQVDGAVNSAWVSVMRISKTMQDLLSADRSFAPVMAGLLKKVENELEAVKDQLNLPAVSTLSEAALGWLEFEANAEREKAT